MKEYKRTYEHILESEKKLDTAKKQLVWGLHYAYLFIHHSFQATYEDKERKYEKELSKGSKDPENAKRKLKTYRDAKSLAESEGISTRILTTHA